MNRIDSELLRDGHYQGNDNNNRGENVHQAAHDEQENVQHDEQDNFAGNNRAHGLENFHGDLFVDQEVGKSHRCAENNQDAADKEHALVHNSGHVAKQI